VLCACCGVEDVKSVVSSALQEQNVSKISIENKTANTLIAFFIKSTSVSLLYDVIKCFTINKNYNLVVCYL